jgi:hypothetical protein
MSSIPRFGRPARAPAAELWDVPADDCAARFGMVRGPRRQASCADLAPDAALLPLARAVTLAAGPPIVLRPAHG